jgi:hypothetical protein
MKKMKILATVLWMAFVVFGMIPSANALSITPTTKLYWFLDMPTNPTTVSSTINCRIEAA